MWVEVDGPSQQLAEGGVNDVDQRWSSDANLHEDLHPSSQASHDGTPVVSIDPAASSLLPPPCQRQATVSVIHARTLL